MKLTVFNGSPRGMGSNTKILMEHFLNGYSETGGEGAKIEYLVRTQEHGKYAGMFRDSDTVILAFPLYTDSMPGIVMAFIEALAPFKGKCAGKKVGFIVQSGFPEAVHSSFIPMYLEKLCKRLGCGYLGTVIRGGVEGIQVMPPSMTKKLFAEFHALGAYFGKNTAFDPEVKARLANPFRFGIVMRFVLRLMGALGLMNFFWNMQLKQNKAFDKRFDKPFEKQGV